MRKLNYICRGLDLRTNELYRKEGTASDCRNVLLDTNKRLIKRNDMDETVIPRGIDGETGDFLSKLPFSSRIISIIPFDDHKLLIVKGSNDALTQTINLYYKWDEDLNTVSRVPSALHMAPETASGNHPYREEYNLGGRIYYRNQENVLFFSGSPIKDNTLSDGTVTQIDMDNNLSPIMKYDGKMVSVAGMDRVIGDSGDLVDSGTLVNQEYLKIVPFTFDNKNRWTFGNTSVHQTSVYGGVNIYLDFLFVDTYMSPSRSSKQAYFRFTGDHTFNSSDSAALRTIPAIFKNTATQRSVEKGQYMFSIVGNNSITTPVIGQPPTSVKLGWKIYRFKIEDVDYVSNEVTLTDFELYNSTTGLFETSLTLDLQDDASQSNAPFCGTYINAIYGSTDYTFGYELRGYSIMGSNSDSPYNDVLKILSPNIAPLASTSFKIFPELLFITSKLEDMYDESYLKLPPPKVKHFVNYLGAIVGCDGDYVYFSDFSVGGNIETFTPFDNIPVGSSEYGKITGVFANETFLAVFRQRETYYISGNLFTLNYRVQSYKSTRVGCSSPSSIIPFKGSGIFVSEKGVFVCAQGGRMEEISDIIDPIFQQDVLGLQLDNFDSKSIVDFKKELIIIDFVSKIDEDTSFQLVYSYYHQEWFIYSDIKSRGCFEHIDDLLYTSDGINVYKESTNSVLNDAYYISNFHSADYPSLDKKYLKLRVSTIGIDDSFELDIKTYRNWDKSQTHTDEAQSGEADSLDITQNLNQGTRSRSMAMELYSPSGNKMIIEGYEYTVQGVSTEVKHDNY